MIKSHQNGKHIQQIAELVGGKAVDELCEFRLHSTDVNESGREIAGKIRELEKEPQN
jgi:hypothetical protein